ncbi:MAG: cell envelope integrity protein TolA, partial [Bacilli bacterium]|nr:cell envelope integrity protein TolA [Bacilli bacterium]
MWEEEPIRDEEMSRYFRAHYEEEVAEKISETTFGKKIKRLEKMNMGVSFQSIVKRYLEVEEATFDNLGNVIIDELSVSTIYQNAVEVVSNKLGFDISKLEIGEIEEITSQYVSGELSANEKVSDTIMKEQVFDRLLQEIGIDKKSDNFIQSTQISMLLKSFEESNLSENEVDEMIALNEEKAVKNNIEALEDVDLLEIAYNVKFVMENEEAIGKECVPSLMKMYMEQIKEALQNSKFASRILTENGELNPESVKAFIENWESERNEANLYNDMTKGLTLNASEITNEDREKLATIFLVASRGTSNENRRLAVVLSKHLGIDVLDRGGNNLSIKKIERNAKEIFGKDADLDEICEQSQMNLTTANEKLEKIREYIYKSIEAGIDMNGKSRDEILEARKNVGKNINMAKNINGRPTERICSKREKIIYDVLNSVNAGNVNYNAYINESLAQNVVVLYCKFREDEIQKNKRGTYEGLDGNSMNTEGQNSNSSIVKKFMIENSKYFEKYLTDLDRIDHEAVISQMNEGRMGTNQLANFRITYQQITKRTEKLDSIEEKENAKIRRLNEKISDFYESRDETGKADMDLQDDIFELAGNISSDALSTDTLTMLNGLNKDGFFQAFESEKVERRIGRNTFKSAYFAVARLFSKLYYIPDTIMNRTKVKEDLPTIRKRQKDEDKAKKREEKRAEQERKKAEKKIEQAEKKKVQYEKREQKKSQQAQKESERRIIREHNQMYSNIRKGLNGILGNLIGKDETKLLDTGNTETTREQISNAEMHIIESENNGKSFATETYENGFIQRVYVDHKLALEKTESARKDQAKTSRGNISGNI